MKYLRKKLLGIVFVDSGSLIVTDPCYISQWQQKGSNPAELHFWGRDEDTLAAYLKKQGQFFKVKKRNSYYSVRHKDYSAEYLQEYLNQIITEKNWLVITDVVEDSVINRAYDIRCSNDMGGQVEDLNGNPGLGVIFSSGLGDGAYGVWAYYTKLPDWGERIAKVEIQLIDEDN
ncbi:hypothetical protein H0A61_02888 [Koleobacter methoxysyntrophicus]|uniref:Uncharacterized protein n=1 Tax=Koleobacter methoxysyntrophicus TaxID=2751313 RepID=A0A8A0RSH6_9FIRM|nr:hypothetical protein [Koleobacter methoxysyntrophicus]QSQ10480.1 hypothetical protein H0A61_02888 [Koleobacter methoxysyntrophicus]